MMDGDGSIARRAKRLCHFGPETPSLSQTFVYREALALKHRGHDVVVATVRAPQDNVPDVEQALGEVFALYSCSALDQWGAFFAKLVTRPVRGAKVIGTLLTDLVKSGFERRFSASLIWHAISAARFAAFLEEKKVEHVHVHFAHYPAQIAMYAEMWSDIPFTVMAHANDIYQNGVLIHEKARRSAGFAMISRFNITSLEEQGVAAANMQLVRCGMPMLSRTTPLPAHTDRPFRIGSLGRLIAKKGMDVTIDAVAALVEEGFDLRLEIVGDGPLRPHLTQRIYDRGLGDRIILKGAMDNCDVLKWLETLNLFVLACRRDASGDIDGIPVAIMEAMALSVPSISTELSGISELVVHGKSGLVVTPSDAEELADAIKSIITHGDLYQTLSEGARSQIDEEFSETINIDRLETLIGLPHLEPVS